MAETSSREELLKALDEAVLKETFTNKAVDGIKVLRDELDRLTGVERDNQVKQSRINELSVEINSVSAEVRAFEMREVELDKAEEDCRFAKRENDLIRQFKGEMYQLVQSVFRNTELRTTYNQPVVIPGQDSEFGNSSTPYVHSEPVTETTEEV